MSADRLLPFVILVPVFITISLMVFSMSGIPDLRSGKFSQLWKGSVSDAHFNTMLEAIFEDPNVHFSGYEVKGGGYVVWVCNGWSFLTFNGIGGFSAKQKYKFYRRFKRWRRFEQHSPHKPTAEEKLTTAAFRAKQDEIVERQLLGDE